MFPLVPTESSPKLRGLFISLSATSRPCAGVLHVAVDCKSLRSQFFIAAFHFLGGDFMVGETAIYFPQEHLVSCKKFCAWLKLADVL